jgi:serine/threonine protein kinase
MRQCPKCNKRFLESNARICDVDGSVLDLIVVASERDRLVGTTILQRYAVDGVLGDGGMGVVYRAKDAITGRTMAVKVLRAEYSAEEDLVQRFEQEARSAAAVNNPHIVEIYDWGSLPDNSRFFVMEYLEGQSLGDLLAAMPKPPGADRREPLSEAFTIHLALQIADGLAAAHAIGIVHRDIKPDNFHIVRTEADPYFVKILDFGIAKVQNSKAARTRTGSVFGTPHYMSPEQASGDRNIDATTDIYGLGVLLYEMVVGKIPFDADNLMGILTAHLYHTPVPPRAFPECENLSPAFEAVILKCMAKTREARYPSMRALHDDLLRCRDEGTSLALDDQECHTQRFARMALSDAELTRPDMPIAPVPQAVAPRPATGEVDAIEVGEVTRVAPNPGSTTAGRMAAVAAAPATPAASGAAAFGPFDRNPIQFTGPMPSYDTPPGVTVPPTVTGTPAAQGRSRVPLGMAIVGAGLLLGTLSFMALGGGRRPDESAATHLAAAPQPAPTARPAVPFGVPGARGGTVTVETPGVAAEVFRGATRLGTTPLAVPRPSAPETYRVVAPGRAPVSVDIGPDADAALRVALPAAPAVAPTEPVAPTPVALPPGTARPSSGSNGRRGHHERGASPLGSPFTVQQPGRPASPVAPAAPPTAPTPPVAPPTRPTQGGAHEIRDPWATN